MPTDKCIAEGACDGAGACTGAAKTCEATNASGGSCVQGECQGYKCDDGWDNCDSDWSNGCETKVSDDPSNCGACNKVCDGGPNGNASCVAKQCTLSCTAPYQDCNGDPTDGCEIPVGQANACSRSGLTTFSTATGATPGCGTPYCGQGSGSAVANFPAGSWYCAFCIHCSLFDDGGAWCLYDNAAGTFSSQRCPSCCQPGGYEQVCSK